MLPLMYSRICSGEVACPSLHAGDRRHDLARRAVAALQGVVVDEGLLHRMQRAVGGDRPSIVVTSRPSAWTARRQAGHDAPAVEMHRAGAALAVVAALLGAGQRELLAQHVEQRGARIEREHVRRAVYGQSNRDCARWVAVGP